MYLYPATAESISALAFDFGQTPRHVAEHALYLGLAHNSLQSKPRTCLQLVIKSPHNT